VVGWHVVGDKVDDSYYAGSCKERGGERERERERERVHRAEKLEESSRDQEALISNKY
jgi:hypothetical protein